MSRIPVPAGNAALHPKTTNLQPRLGFAFPDPSTSGQGNIPAQSITGFALGGDNGRIHEFNASPDQQSVWLLLRGLVLKELELQPID